MPASQSVEHRIQIHQPLDFQSRPLEYLWIRLGLLRPLSIIKLSKSFEINFITTCVMSIEWRSDLILEDEWQRALIWQAQFAGSKQEKEMKSENVQELCSDKEMMFFHNHIWNWNLIISFEDLQNPYLTWRKREREMSEQRRWSNSES